MKLKNTLLAILYVFTASQLSAQSDADVITPYKNGVNYYDSEPKDLNQYTLTYKKQ